MTKKILKTLAATIVAILIALTVIIAGLRIAEWQPDDVEPTIITEIVDGNPDSNTMHDTIIVVSWNIGYAGLGADMDFFYDGGTKTRTSEKQTQKNLTEICQWLDNCNADVIMLQEVDFDAKRSYHINQYDTITQYLENYNSTYAWNYVATFVPMPISEPMGDVVSGLVTLSKTEISKAHRIAYPSKFDFPMRLFNLKRCLLSVNLTSKNGNEIIFNNTHNTAFDTGNMRAQEFDFLKGFITQQTLSFTAGDWNSTPPGYVASKEELENEFFAPIAVTKDALPSEVTIAADTNPENPTARYNYQPYEKGVTTTTVIDFGVATKGIQVISTQTIDLNFKNSDHNPVVYKLRVLR